MRSFSQSGNQLPLSSDEGIEVAGSVSPGKSTRGVPQTLRLWAGPVEGDAGPAAEDSSPLWKSLPRGGEATSLGNLMYYHQVQSR